MERISEEDVDCFLQQMKRLSEADSAIDMRQEERRHFQDFCIWIPEVFRQTEIENAEEIFWSERLPDVVFLNEDKTAGITLEGSAVKAYWLEYKSFAADVRVYNVLFIFCAGSKEILGTFFCRFEEYEQWKPVIWEMMRTIKEEYKHERT